MYFISLFSLLTCTLLTTPHLQKGLPVPKDEKGFSGVAEKAEATVTQLSRNVETGLRDVGKKMGALWSRFKR